MSSKAKTTATRDEMLALVPRLRFPEFRDAAGWNEVDFADAIFFQEGPGIMAVDFRDEGVPLVRLSGLAGQSVSLDGCNYLDPNKVEQKWAHFRLEAGDIVVSCSASFGRPATVTEIAAGAVFYTGLVRFRVKGGRICVSYLEVFLGSNIFLLQAESFAVGGGIKHFGPSHLRQMKVPLPRIPEQQKIAECLTTLDEVIAAQSQKLDALKTHKKGLMQQLFPREGEILPRLRFPEFQASPGWEVREISTFAKVTTGGKDTQNKVEGGTYPFFVRSQTVERINSYSVDGEAVLTSGDGVGVGKNFHYIKGMFDFHQRVYCIYEFAERVSGLFFYLYFSEHFNERVMRMSAKNSVDSVRMAMITKMPVFLPSLPEQQRIAACLTTLDDLITAQSAKLESLKTHKKGLMQQLFPFPKEVEA